ncbi:MAG: putative DNA modification/repair radical SAM protein [Lachnospiraceae bacterium]|nr:putative DNA modification/repair radical SAM protein [Lachnospiraceae bacterium]MCI8825244.1 putative DNA modification/repair radical SAM protein [Lachnospiraceae bacterium]
MKDYVLIQSNMPLEEKLKILSAAAKYDVSCSSSGVERKGNGKDTGSASAAGICHSFASDGRCISLLKILLTNECIFDCKYCINRISNDVLRASFTPDEVCHLTMEFYRRNYIEGLFLSSGIMKSPDYTMGLIYEAIYRLRTEYRFNGYIHVKAIPGSDPEMLEQLGYLVDRMSVNLELPTSDGLSRLAPHKSRKNILKPMKEIQTGIQNNRKMHGIYNKKQHITMTNGGYDQQKQIESQNTDQVLSESYLAESRESLSEKLKLSKVPSFAENQDIALISENQTGNQNTNLISESWTGNQNTVLISENQHKNQAQVRYIGTNGKYFVPAGQSTQMIIGATPESDYHIINVTQALYDNYDLKRVFYSAYVPLNEDKHLPALDTKPPLLREHRLYQADWLLRFYGFYAKELLTEDRPYFNEFIDPKCDWAVRHLELFPVEINKADYYTLLRVPGIGVKSAKRIIAARRYGTLDFQHIKKMGVVLKRALYFITCGGKMMYDIKMEENYITNQLIFSEPVSKQGDGKQFRQMTIFDFIN